MKTLYIVRHAKSSWDHLGLDDHQRPLLEKGKKRTKYVIDYFLRNNEKPELIISSYAVRAFETAKLFANGLNYLEENIVVSKEMYFSDTDTLYNYFFDLSNDLESLMMVGHNPTFTYFANNFLEDYIDNLPTSGVVCIEFLTDKWEDVVTAKKRTKFVITPRQLKEKATRKNN